MVIMQKAIRLTAVVSSDHEVVISHPLLEPGMTVEVVILLPGEVERKQLYIGDTANNAEGQQQTDTSEVVNQPLDGSTTHRTVDHSL